MKEHPNAQVLISRIPFDKDVVEPSNILWLGRYESVPSLSHGIFTGIDEVYFRIRTDEASIEFKVSIKDAIEIREKIKNRNVYIYEW